MLNEELSSSPVAQAVEHLDSNLNVAGSSLTVGKSFLYYILSLSCAPYRSTKPIQMISSITFIRGYRYIVIERMTI